MTRASGFWSKTAFNQYSIFFFPLPCSVCHWWHWHDCHFKNNNLVHLLCIMTPPPPSNSQTLQFIHLHALSVSWFCPPPVAAQWSFVSSWGPPPENEQVVWQHGQRSLPPTPMHIHVHTHNTYNLSLSYLHISQSFQSNTHSLCLLYTHKQFLSLSLSHTYTHTHTQISI